MPETLEPPAAPKFDVKNFIKGNLALGAPESTAIAPVPANSGPPPEPPAKPAEAAKPTAEPASGVDDGYDFEKPDRAKPPKNKKHWDGFLDANERRKQQYEQDKTVLKTELDLVKQQIAESQKLVSTPRNDAELDALKKERDDLSAKLYTVARERHPDFTKKYDAKVGEQIADVKMLVGGEIGDKIVKLLNAPESEWRTASLKEALAEVDDLDRPALRTAWLNVDKLNRQRTAELSTSREEFEAMKMDHERKTVAQQSEQAKQQSSMADKLFDAGLETLTKGEKKLVELMTRKDDKAFNEGLQGRIAAARKIIHGEAAPEMVVESILRGEAYPIAAAERDALRIENEKLTAQVEALTKANPKLIQPSSVIPGSSPQTAFTRDTTPARTFRGYVDKIRADE